MNDLAKYDPEQDYLWNFEHVPEPPRLEVSPCLEPWILCGKPVNSPLGIAAGPLLNGRWILYYAALGFDVLTYKTVRSVSRDCYPLPNLQFVESDSLQGGEQAIPATTAPTDSWAVSFGMPSMEPKFWRKDIENTKAQLATGQWLNVSVVGTIQPGWGVEELADDYALCARWAVESGADSIETNFSCPNVATCDGQLYQQPASSRLIAKRVRDAVGSTPYLVKIGHLTDQGAAEELLQAVAPFVDAVVMTNTIPATVAAKDGSLMWEGQKRGIGGAASYAACLRQAKMCNQIIRDQQLPLEVIGVGGIRTAEDVRAYLDAGCTAVQLATAAMLDPTVAIQIRSQWAATTEVKPG